MTDSGSLFSYRSGDVAVVVLNRPAAHNALGTPLLLQLRSAVVECSIDAGAIVLASEGRHFCAGADLVEISAAFGDRNRIGSYLELFQDVADTIAKSSVPVIAAVQGFALAGGLELALACDLIVAAEDAEFGDQHINVDLIPGGGGSQRLPRAIGTRRALALQMLGDRIDANRALDWGLVHRVYSQESLRQEAIHVAAEIASHHRLALSHIRELGRVASTCSLPDGLAIELAMAVDHLSGSELPKALRRIADRTGNQ